jgi:hypothetical protein
MKMKLPWQQKEKKDAKKFGGKQTFRSGGIWFAPGDLKSDDFLFDSKLTTRKSFSVTKKMWDKIEKEAINSNRTPALLIQFSENVELVVLNTADFKSWFKQDKT